MQRPLFFHAPQRGTSRDGIQPRHHRRFMVTYFQIVIIAMFYGLLSATNVLILIISPVKKGVYQVLITIQRYDFS